jgi:hypothetical protein
MGIYKPISEEVDRTHSQIFSDGKFFAYEWNAEGTYGEELIRLGKLMIERVYLANKSSFNEYEQIYEDKKSELHLQIFMKTYASDSKAKINIFRSEFEMPCSAEHFIRFMNDVPLQQKLDSNVDQFYVAEKVANYEDAVILYLSYKKVLTASSREFVYFKRIENIRQGVWCDASRSIEYPSKFPETKDKVRGSIILSGHTVEDMETDDGRRRCRVRMYTENDFKFNMPVFLSKTFSIKEMKNYSEKCYKALQGENVV